MNLKNKSKIIYNETLKTYTKYFYPDFKKKIKYIFRFRKYPGYNFKYIANVLQKLNLNVPKILKYDKYMVVTKQIEGIDLYEKLLISNKTDSKILLDEYINIVSTIINNDIYFGDFSFDNFIYCSKNSKIYVIDLEDYRKNFLSQFRKKETLKRIEKKLHHLEILKEHKHYYTSTEIIEKIINKTKDTNK